MNVTRPSLQLLSPRCFDSARGLVIRRIETVNQLVDDLTALGNGQLERFLEDRGGRRHDGRITQPRPLRRVRGLGNCSEKPSPDRIPETGMPMRALKLIRTKSDYEEALGEVEQLWGARRGTPKGDRLDVLATLIDVYENEHHPIDPPDPIDAIKFRMEQQGLVRKDLEGIIGTRTRVAEVLNRRRPLSIGMIRRLHAKLGVPAEILIHAT